MISKNHYINLANGRFDDTNTSDLDAAFASYNTTQPPSGWVIHFHGGLVREQRALETAESLRSAYAEAGAYPFFFIWESGAWETFRNNLRDIAEETLFKKVVSYLVEYLLDKLGIDPGVLTAESNLPGERPQVEVENWMKRQEQADAAVSPQAPYDGIRNEEASKSLTGHEVDPGEIEALMRGDEELLQELNRLNAELRNAPASSEATDSGLGYRTPGHLSPAALQELTGVNHQPGQTPQLNEAVFGITLARLAIAAARIGYSVIRRYMKGRDHGLYTTVVEEVLRDLYVDQIGSTLFWNQMKRDTLDAFGDNENLYGGTAFVKRLAQQLENVTPAPRVTLVAHSAGAQFVCHFLLHAHRQLNPSLQFDVILLAPAVDFELMQQAIQTKRIANFRVFALTDEYEAKDALLAPISNTLKYVYPKSLLYLVSGLLETEVDRPLVGMERYYLGQQYTGRMFSAVTAIRQYLSGGTDRMVWTPTTSGAPGLTSKCTRHTDFNVGDPATLSSVRHILANGFAPPTPTPILDTLESVLAMEIPGPSLDMLVDQLSEPEAIEALNGFSTWFKNSQDLKSQPEHSAKLLTSLSNSVPTASQAAPLSDGELAKMTLKVAAKNELCQQSLTKFVGTAMKLRPLDDRVVVEPLESEATTAGGIVLPDAAKEKPQRGKVIAVGPGRLLDSGERHPISVQIGDEVLFSKYGGTQIEVDAKDIKILSESDILATLDSPKSSPALSLDSVLVGLQSQVAIKDTASGFDVSVQQPSYELSRSVGEYVSRGQKKKKTPDPTAGSSDPQINESRVIAALAELPAQDLEAVYSRCWKGEPQTITAKSVPQHAKLLVDHALSKGAELQDLLVNANLAVPSAGLLQQFIPTYQRVSHGLRQRLMTSPSFQLESIEPSKSPAVISMTLRLRSPKVGLENVPGLKVISRMGTIVVARGTAESVAALEQNDDVLAIDGPSNSAMPECIKSMTHIRADIAKSKSEEAGEECLIAVIDGGIDIFHEAFRKANDPGETRLIGIWDLTDNSGLPPAGQVIGTWHSAGDIKGYLAANAPGKNLTRDPVGHGTHVTSIAAGTRPADPGKRAAFPGGVAHEAPILAIIVGDSQYEDGAPSQLGYSETHVTALGFIHHKAEELKLPVAVNISQGEQAGGHDGTTLLEAAIDQFCEVGRAPGRVVVKSSGNNRADMGHAYLTMSAGSQEDLDWNSAVQKQWPKGRFKDVIEIWFNTSKRMAFQLITPDADTSDPANLTNPNPQGTLPNGNTYRMQYSERFRDNGHGRLRIEITNGTANSIQDGKWQLEIVNGDPLKPQEIHAWVERTDWQPVSFTNFPSVDITLTVPGTAKSVITVAAVETAAHVRVAKFSGYGGTRTGAHKPEISAPGVGIVAAQSGTTFGFVPKSGTSMAAPHVTGAIALLMSACHKRRATMPMPSANEIREAFAQLNVANVWDRGAGYGVLDIDKLLDHFGPFSPADLPVAPGQLIAAAQPAVPAAGPAPTVAPATAGGQS